MNDQKSLNQALFDALMSEQLPQVNNVAGGTHSFGVVNSRQNGKRRQSFSAKPAYLHTTSRSIIAYPEAKEKHQNVN